MILLAAPATTAAGRFQVPARPAYDAPSASPRFASWVRTGMSDEAFARSVGDMDGRITLRLAAADQRQGPWWGLQERWRRTPDPSWALTGPEVVARAVERAIAINMARPIAGLPNPSATPFDPSVASLGARAKAAHCLTQAIYYEAAWEPLGGKQAVAQVVLNRVRHPAFPKSVCGVVFQGSHLRTGCQFSFTCDGALRRIPVARAWEEAEVIAERALDGFVMTSVGTATHYHAVYVAPYWAPALIKITGIGAHVFYRWPGAAGAPGAFNGRYSGEEGRWAEPVEAPQPILIPIANVVEPSVSLEPLLDPVPEVEVVLVEQDTALEPEAAVEPPPAPMAAEAPAPPQPDRIVGAPARSRRLPTPSRW